MVSQPSEGRGRTFEPCRAHQNAKPRESAIHGAFLRQDSEPQGTGVQPAPLFQAENTTAGTVRSLVAAEPVSAML
jgi:hypothetical protein